jgi:hypothetical protein
MNLNKGLIISLIGFVFFLASCQWLTVEPVEIDVDVVSFATDIEPVLTSKCATCHTSTKPVLSGGNAYNSLVNGSFVNTVDPPSSIIVVKTNTGHGGLTPTEKALLLAWIEQGAQNN